MKLGMTAALSGSLPFDLQISNGIKLAVNQINKAGGVGGKVKLALTVQDTGSDTTKAVTEAKSYADGGTSVVFAECNADAQVAEAAVLKQSNALVMSACDAAPKIGAQYPNYWGVGLSPNMTMAALAQYAASKGYKRVYVMNSTDLLYDTSLTSYFEKAATHLGIKVIGSNLYTVGATNYSSQIAQIQAALGKKPDAIFSPIFVPDVGTFVKQLRAAGVTTPFLTGDGSDSPLLLSIAGSASNGTCLSTHAFPEAGTPTADFYKLYDQTYGGKLDTAFAAVGYNMVKVLEAAVTKAQSTDPAAISKALAGGLSVSAPNTLWSISYPSGQHWPVYAVPVDCVKAQKFYRAAYSVPTYIPPV